MTLARLRLRTTDGERCLALAYLIVALFGAGLAFVVATQISGGELLQRSLTNYERWLVLTGGIGGAGALYLAGDKMGQEGLIGHLRAIPAVIWVSFVGALISGTLSLPFYGTMFGPFTLGVTLVGSPVLACLWFANLFAAHILIGAWRAERDTLFRRNQLDQHTNPAIRQGRVA